MKYLAFTFSVEMTREGDYIVLQPFVDGDARGQAPIKFKRNDLVSWDALMATMLNLKTEVQS